MRLATVFKQSVIHYISKQEAIATKAFFHEQTGFYIRGDNGFPIAAPCVCL